MQKVRLFIVSLLKSSTMHENKNGQVIFCTCKVWFYTTKLEFESKGKEGVYDRC